MKKNYFLLLMLPLVLFLGSCQKTEVVVPNRTILTEVRPGNWVTSNGGRTYSAAIDMPEITSFFNEHGGVLVYVSFSDIDYEAIPQVFDGVSYRYVTKPGQIIITIENFDGEPSVVPPSTIMDVKIVLIESR